MNGRAKPGLLAVIGMALLILAQSQPATASSSALEKRLGPGAVVRASAETGGQVTFIGTQAGAAIPLAAARPRAAAIEAAARFGPRFGLRDDARLWVTAVSPRGAGRTAVRLQQTIEGLPVIGGELAVTLDAAGDLLSIGGELEPREGIGTAASVGEAQASATARAAAAKHHGVPVVELRSGSGELSIYDSRLLGGPGLELPRPVWKFEVTDSGPRTIRELVLVDARLGNVALSFSQIERAKSRWVCDAEFTESHYICLFENALRTEGESASGIAEADSAYDLSGLVYDFYSGHVGRDSIDDEGMPIVANVRYCQTACPVYENAFWNGLQMTFGPGWVTDDILGHELTHGVVERESGLFYYYQSGAINESFADVFGELFDLSTGADPPADRWLMSEDAAGGAIRDMADPTEYGDADRTGSFYWYSNPDTSYEAGDRGGVHSNSGVGNKLAYLLTDGDSFNGRTVSPLGADEVLSIFDEANVSLLTSASDYADLGQALRQACANLVGQEGIVSADCGEVDEAVLATEMDLTPPVAPREAALCPGGGQASAPVFADGLEDPESANWSTSVASGPNAFYYPQSSYAASGSNHIRGYDLYGVSDSAIEMNDSVTVPAGGKLHFRHAYGFESSEEVSYDGGVIEYSTDGGASWHDAGELIVAGEDYTDVLYDEAGNPLSGRLAFAGDSAGYGSTRLDLTSLAGEQVRFRFRIGTDEALEDYGWFIDDIQIYTCSGGGGGGPVDGVSGGGGGSGVSIAAPATQPAATSDDCVEAKVTLALARARATRTKRALERARLAGAEERRIARLQQATRRDAQRARRARAAVRRAC